MGNLCATLRAELDRSRADSNPDSNSARCDGACSDSRRRRISRRKEPRGKQGLLRQGDWAGREEGSRRGDKAEAWVRKEPCTGRAGDKHGGRTDGHCGGQV